MNIPLKKVSSSQVVAVGYEPGTHTMRVQFENGGTYDYADVPAQVHVDFMASDSKGKFLASRVKGRYGYTRVDDAPEAA